MACCVEIISVTTKWQLRILMNGILCNFECLSFQYCCVTIANSIIFQQNIILFIPNCFVRSLYSEIMCYFEISWMMKTVSAFIIQIKFDNHHYIDFPQNTYLRLDDQNIQYSGPKNKHKHHLYQGEIICKGKFWWCQAH